MKNKVLYSVLCCITIFTVLCSLFVVPSFASDEESYDITPTVYLNGTLTSASILHSGRFISAGIEFYDFNVSASGSLTYLKADGSSIMPYANHLGGWTLSDFRLVTFLDPVDPNSEFYTWLMANSVVVEEPDPSTFSWYQMLYDIIHSGVYGGLEMTSDQVFVCTLLSTILCVITFCVPFIIVFWIVKFLFGWRL